ncbi:hypothetical protein [Bordetella bronchialis]|uniref:Uncharacterized protein n=1 Tax=Bordetella bronchialis TaxID=463025 RepID=A0A193FT28_9BORD|nr:hypothetical protein [Bordetella bronchialis]ANN70907.1 hypothetical protein BAU08_05795 [Bordetella bronchialis]
MSKKSLVAPFASLLGIGRARAEDAPADDDERKQRPDESDEDYAKRMEEMDDDEARRAEDDKPDEDAAAEDDDEDDKKDDDAKAARAQERARCARIIAHGIKVGAVRQAGVFAFDTSMSAQSAIAALDAGRAESPAARKPGLAERMAAARTPNPGAGGAGGAQLTRAQQIVLAGKKRRGEQV